MSERGYGSATARVWPFRPHHNAYHGTDAHSRQAKTSPSLPTAAPPRPSHSPRQPAFGPGVALAQAVLAVAWAAKVRARTGVARARSMSCLREDRDGPCVDAKWCVRGLAWPVRGQQGMRARAGAVRAQAMVAHARADAARAQSCLRSLTLFSRSRPERPPGTVRMDVRRFPSWRCRAGKNPLGRSRSELLRFREKGPFLLGHFGSCKEA